MTDETMTLEQVRDRLRDEYALIEKDSLKYAECAYHVPAYVLDDLADAIDSAIAARTVTTLTDALRALEEYAMAGVTLGTDDSKRLHATVDRIAPIAERKAREWQPIESGPRDGQRVLLRSPIYTFTGKHAAGSWIDDAGQFRDPTHWMPRPAAPKVTP